MGDRKICPEVSGSGTVRKIFCPEDRVKVSGMCPEMSGSGSVREQRFQKMSGSVRKPLSSITVIPLDSHTSTIK